MCNEDVNDVRKRLIVELRFDESIATAYAKSKGRCEYCKRDLIHDRLGYACAQLDHLLPVSKVAQKIADIPANWVLSCSYCNGEKRAAWLLCPDEDPITMLTDRRQELIERARKYIQCKAIKRDQDWEKAREILLGVNRH